MTTRLDHDRDVVRRVLPRNTTEQWNDKLGTAVWYYRVDNELGVSFEFCSFFDGGQYRTALLQPAGLEQELLRRSSAHDAHVFSNGYICLGDGGGVSTLEECWSKTGMWAYNVAAFLQAGEWLFLNR